MKLQDQVTPLHLAKRLKELGLEQYGCTYYWYEQKVNGITSFVIKSRIIITESCNDEENESIRNALDGRYKNECYAAPNCAELGQMLPSETYTQRTGTYDSEYANWEWVDNGNDDALGVFNTETEARAHHLIYMLETGLLTADQANKRLLA